MIPKKRFTVEDVFSNEKESSTPDVDRSVIGGFDIAVLRQLQ